MITYGGNDGFGVVAVVVKRNTCKNNNEAS